MKVQWDFDADDNSLPVMVPRSDKTLAAIPPKRVRQLREHLIKALGELRTAKPWERLPRVAAGACWFPGPRSKHCLFHVQGMVL